MSKIILNINGWNIDFKNEKVHEILCHQAKHV